MKYFYILLFLILICSFSIDKKTDKDVLPDSLFVLKNISSSDITKNFRYDYKTDSYYTDTTKKISFIGLDSNYRKKILAPAFDKLNLEFFNKCGWTWFMPAFFISKQEKVGDILPIIVHSSGTDFSAFILVTLDKNCNVVSSYILKGGACAGPTCPLIHSVLNKDKISSYILYFMARPDSISMTIPTTIDSISFQSKINADGKIVSKKVDSTRFKRLVKWNEL
jgi:hypothetical protein